MENRCGVGPGAALPARTSGPAEDLRPRPRRHTVPANEILIRLTYNSRRRTCRFFYFGPLSPAMAVIVCSMTPSDLHGDRNTCMCTYISSREYTRNKKDVPFSGRV